MTLEENRQAGKTRLHAVLFVDQVGSTALLQELGDVVSTQMRHVMRPIMQSSVVEYNGRVVKSTGDGLMAVFDGASDALAAGIAMHRRAARANRFNETAAPIEFRVAVSAGDVTVDSDDCHGTPVVEAARLEAAAPNGGMLCTDIVRVLAGNRTTAVFTNREQVEAKGFTEPIEAWQVDWGRHLDRRFHQLPDAFSARGQYQFVGRHAELRSARHAWQRTLAGENTGLLIGGEPGAGKTRLARELALEVLDEGGLVLYGRCDENMGLPFQPFTQALSQYCIANITAPELGRLPGELRRLLPSIETFVADLPELDVANDAELSRSRLYDAVSSWLEAVGEETPLLVVIDDLQWATDPTHRLLRHVMLANPQARVQIVGTYRDTEADETASLSHFLADMHRIDRMETVHLSGLDAAGISDLLTSADLLGATTKPEALIELIRTQTAGNPFFVTELLGMLRDQGVTALQKSQSSALSDVVLDRVSRLPALARKLLDIAAVSGWTIGLDVLAAASGDERGNIVDAIETALRAGLLVEDPDPPVQYRFQHDLVRSSLYDNMSLGRRTQTHLELARAIEQVHGMQPPEFLDDLAHHYFRSDHQPNLDRAIDVCRLAGDQAAEALGFADAAEHYTNALTLMKRTPEEHRPEVRGELLLSLGIAKKRAGQRDSRNVLFAAAREAAKNKDTPTLVRAALGNTRGFFSAAGRIDEERVSLLETALEAVGPDDSPHRAKLLANLSVELTFGRDNERREALSAESVAIAERLNDAPTLVHVLNQRIGCLWNADGLDERLQLGERLQRAANELDIPQWQFTAASSQFQAAMESGDLALADRCIDEMLGLVELLRQPTVESYLRLRQSVRHIVNGELDEGERLATKCFELGQAAGQPDAYTFYFAQLFNLRWHQGRLEEITPIFEKEAAQNQGLPVQTAGLAMAYCDIGEHDKARALLDDLAGRAESMHRDLSWLTTIACMADACFRLEDRHCAVRLHEHLVPYRGQFVDNATNWLGSVERFVAMTEHTMGNFSLADECFAKAELAHVGLPAPAVLARTRLDWATSLLNRPIPDPHKARQLLEAALPEAERMGLDRVASSTHLLLSSLVS